MLERLGAAVDPLYDGEVKTTADGVPVAQRYAVLYMAPAHRTSEDLCLSADRHAYRWQVTSVGQSPEQADWVATRCRDALLDERLAEAGWELAKIEHTASSPIRRDDDIPGAVLFYAVDNYELTATR